MVRLSPADFERFFTRIANSKMNDNFKWMLYAENRRHRSQQMLVVMSFLVHLRKISNNKVNMDFFRGRNGLNCIINTYREIGF
jgi:allantoicase